VQGVGRVRTVRSAAARGKRGSGSGHAIGIAIGLLGTLVRALGLRRAALFLEDAPGRPLRRVAAHGAVTLDVLSQGESPGDEPWTAVLPVRASDRTRSPAKTKPPIRMATAISGFLGAISRASASTRDAISASENKTCGAFIHRPWRT